MDTEQGFELQEDHPFVKRLKESREHCRWLAEDLAESGATECSSSIVVGNKVVRVTCKVIETLGTDLIN